MRTYFRGVAYINTDVCMSGPILEPVASPTLMEILVPATKDIFSPIDETQNYYALALLRKGRITRTSNVVMSFYTTARK